MGSAQVRREANATCWAQEGHHSHRLRSRIHSCASWNTSSCELRCWPLNNSPSSSSMWKGCRKLSTVACNLWLSKGWPTKQAIFTKKKTVRLCGSKQAPLFIHHCSSCAQHSCDMRHTRETHTNGPGTMTMAKAGKKLHQQEQALEYSSLRPGTYSGIAARVPVKMLNCSSFSWLKKRKGLPGKSPWKAQERNFWKPGTDRAVVAAPHQK